MHESTRVGKKHLSRVVWNAINSKPPETMPNTTIGSNGNRRHFLLNWQMMHSSIKIM